MGRMYWRHVMRWSTLLNSAFHLDHANGDVASGWYLFLHRQSGRYLFPNGSLGLVESSALPIWELRRDLISSAAGKPSSARYSVVDIATGRVLGSPSLGEGRQLVESVPVSPGSSPLWDIFRVCQGSSVVIVDELGRALSADSQSLEVSVTSDDTRGENKWVLLRTCPHEDGGNRPAWQQECFPVGTAWALEASACCDTKLHGARGNPSCFDEFFNFERCCPEEAREQSIARGTGSITPVSLAPRILCSGERIEGEERSVKLVDFDGQSHWHKSKELMKLTKLDFGNGGGLAAEANTLQVVTGLPPCGGPGLIQEAIRLLPSTELHMADIFWSLHEAMVRLAENSVTEMPELASNIYYLPFFPFLLVTLHRITQDMAYLNCLAKTSVALGRLPSWQRNAGYDFVLALGYDRLWERRAPPGLPEDVYQLQAYDPRFVNTIVLATHDAFFGDRHVLFHTNYGGNLYRNLRHIIVPLPFTLNCTSLRQSSARRKRHRSRFVASFVGSVNGASRDLIRHAAEKLRHQLHSAADSRSLALHFVLNDDERAKLSQEPQATLQQWFGEDVRSFEQLLLESEHCLVLPGDVSDLAMRFYHALSVGCTPVVVGGATQTIPLPFTKFIDYTSFARFATIHTEVDATNLLNALVSEQQGPELEPLRRSQPGPEAFAGLFMRHEDCGFSSGEPFRRSLAKELSTRAQIWNLFRWHN